MIVANDRNYFEYVPDADNYASVDFNTEEDQEQIINGFFYEGSLVDIWRKPKCTAWDDNPPLDGDFPSVSTFCRTPMLSERAWEILRPYLLDECEVLPVIHPFDTPYYLLHVLHATDALDVERSEVRRYTSGSKRIARVYCYAFHEEKLIGKHIFRLPLSYGGGLYIDDTFRRIVEENGLQGLLFRELPMMPKQS